MPATETTTFSLYGDEVSLTFNPTSPRYRYTVEDRYYGKSNEPVRGVTTILRDILHKPDLIAYQMNEAMKHLFGAKWDDNLKKWYYDPGDALLLPEVSYNTEQLQGALEGGMKAHNKRSDRGKDMGTMFHTLAEHYLLGEVDFMKQAAQFEPSEEDLIILTKMMGKLCQWWESFRTREVIFIEKPVYSRNLGYAGTIDLVAMVKGKLVLIDLKTTNPSRKAPKGIYADNFLQLGAYAHALQEEHGLEFDDLAIVNVNKQAQLNVLSAKDMNISVDDCVRAFAFALRLHDWLGLCSRAISESATLKSYLNPLKVDKVE